MDKHLNRPVDGNLVSWPQMTLFPQVASAQGEDTGSLPFEKHRGGGLAPPRPSPEW